QTHSLNLNPAHILNTTLKSYLRQQVRSVLIILNILLEHLRLPYDRIRQTLQKLRRWTSTNTLQDPITDRLIKRYEVRQTKPDTVIVVLLPQRKQRPLLRLRQLTHTYLRRHERVTLQPHLLRLSQELSLLLRIRRPLRLWPDRLRSLRRHLLRRP